MSLCARTQLRATVTALMLVACGGVTIGDPSEGGGGGGGTTSGDGGAATGSGGGAATGGANPSSGGFGTGSGGAIPATGGAAASTGGAGPVLPDCTTPVAGGTACSVRGAHCGGPCSNSWQVENVCNGGIWEYVRVARCGPDASHAPECKNSFSGGELTPCCPTASLDCAGKPDGYPGFSCTPSEGSFCSCTCYGGGQSCGC